MQTKKRGAPDFILLLLTFILVGFGIFMVFSSSFMVATDKFQNPWFFTTKQIIWSVAGLLMMFFFMNVPYMKLAKMYVGIFVFVIILLVSVLIFGEEANNAKSWFNIGPVGIQPTEFAKLASIIYIATLISKKGEKYQSFKRGLLPVLLIVGIVCFLIMLQPDFGSCVILLAGTSVVILIGGANLKHIGYLFLGIFLIPIPLFTIYLFTSSSQEYKLDRIETFLNPWSDYTGAGYQLIQSMFAFGHGGFTGAGFGQSIQKHPQFIAEAYNDFIFSIIGEELGFIGVFLFVSVFMLFVWRAIYISLRCNQKFGTLAGMGIISMFTIQALINMGGVSGAIPMTGVPLPFISYGGSSLITSLIAVGILLSISRAPTQIAQNQTKSKINRFSA